MLIAQMFKSRIVFISFLTVKMNFSDSGTFHYLILKLCSKIPDAQYFFTNFRTFITMNASPKYMLEFLLACMGNIWKS